MTKISMPLEPSLGTKLLSFTLPHCVAHLLLTPRIIHLSSGQLSIRTHKHSSIDDAWIVQSIINNLKGTNIPPMVFTNYHDRGSNLQPPDKRAGT